MVSYDTITLNVSMTMSLDINANTLLLSSLSDQMDASLAPGLDGKYNYIPFELVDRLGKAELHRHQLECLYDTLGTLEAHILSAVTEAIPDRDQYPSPEYYVELIELYSDEHCPDAIGFLKQLQPSFSRSFDRSDATLYPTWSSQEVAQGNSMCLSAKPYVGLRLKLYAKTYDSVRVEATFDKRQVAQLNGNSNRLPGIDPQSFDLVLSSLVPFASSEFPDIGASHSPTSELELTQAAEYRIARRCPTEHDYLLIRSALVNTGRVTGKGLKYPKALYDLYQKGVLSRVRRGVYTLSQEYGT